MTVTEQLAGLRPGDVHALVREDGVHGSVYTSPQVFGLEMQRIFREGWVFVAHESEVPRARRLRDQAHRGRTRGGGTRQGRRGPGPGQPLYPPRQPAATRRRGTRRRSAPRTTAGRSATTATTRCSPTSRCTTRCGRPRSRTSRPRPRRWSGTWATGTPRSTTRRSTGAWTRSSSGSAGCSGRRCPAPWALQGAHGAAVVHDALCIGPPHTLIYPNLFLAETNVMTVEQLSSGETIAYTTPVLIP